MSSWDTNTHSNFCETHWENMSYKWYQGTTGISTPLEIGVVTTHFHVQHGTRLEGYKAGECNKTSTLYGIFIVTPSLEVRLTLLNTNPVFQCLGLMNWWIDSITLCHISFRVSAPLKYWPNPFLPLKKF